MSKKPDGYSLSGNLRRARRTYNLSATAQALYYELVAVANEAKWPDWFSCSNAELCSALCISENTLQKSRIELEKAGLIVYENGKSKRQFGKYSFHINAATTSNFDIVNKATTSNFEANNSEAVPVITSNSADCIKQKKNKQLHATATIYLSKAYADDLKKMFGEKTTWPEEKICLSVGALLNKYEHSEVHNLDALVNTWIKNERVEESESYYERPKMVI